MEGGKGWVGLECRWGCNVYVRLPALNAFRRETQAFSLWARFDGTFFKPGPIYVVCTLSACVERPSRRR